MLYPKNQSEKLSQQLFAQPTSEYRAAPFWAWNCRLDEATLKEQIDVLLLVAECLLPERF